MAMAMHPQIQARAYNELEQLLNSDRLPAVEDKHTLVYFSAVIKETMRWNPVLPLSKKYSNVPVAISDSSILQA